MFGIIKSLFYFFPFFLAHSAVKGEHAVLGLFAAFDVGSELVDELVFGVGIFGKD